MQTRSIEYSEGSTTLQGYIAFDEKISGKRPAVIVAHDWTGHNEFARKKAEKLAELGYIAFALDMYGKGVLAKSVDEKKGMLKPFFDDRTLMRRRVTAAFETVKKLEDVDTNKIGAIGFCFGGLCVIDLARTGADVRGVVGFHSLLLPPPADLPNKPIKAKILALHGYDDPMVPFSQVETFANEMTKDNADWQIYIYGHAKHAFAIPTANDNKLGTVYNELAEKRAWIAMKDFFAEIFA